MAAPRAHAITPAQRQFAVGIVTGKTKIDAYAAAHPASRMNRKALGVQAAKAAKSPNVQAEIQRLMADPVLFTACPEATDPTIIRAHGVAIMVKVSRCSDMAIAAHAADWLVRYADNLEARQAAAKAKPSDEKQRLLADLRGLYSKALAAPKPAPLVETVIETERVAESEPVVVAQDEQL